MTDSPKINRTQTLRAGQWILVLTLGLALCACSGSSPYAEPKINDVIIKRWSETQRENGNIEQSNFLSDGRVSEEEMLSSFELMKSCFVDGTGYSMQGPYFDPLTSVGVEMRFNAEGLDVEQGMKHSDVCAAKYWNDVYQAYLATSEQSVAADLVQYVSRCASSAAGVTVPEGAISKDELLGNFNGSAEEKKRFEVLSSCLAEGQMTLYAEPRPR